jgi:hypothetical protein
MYTQVMKMMKKTLLIGLTSSLLVAVGISLAIDTDDSLAPPPPPAVQSGESLEPEVTIIDKGEQTITEYSINGRVYATKITPKRGAPYYLIDKDGDGVLETRQSDIEGTPNVPQWILFSW